MPSTFYLDPENGSDAADGTTFANRWKTLTSGATAARIAPGDTIRIIKSVDPTSLGMTATWTNLSATVTLNSALNVLITDCETAWTQAANVTSTAETTVFITGSKSAKHVIAGAFGTGKIAYFDLGSNQNYSAYQGITFWFQTNLAIAASTLSIRLCSDATGDVTQDTLTIPATSTVGIWRPIYIDKGSALYSAVRSIAIYADLDPGNATIYLDNISTTKAAGNDCLNLTTLIGKNTTHDGWWQLKSISGTTLLLGTNALYAQGPAGITVAGYYGTTEAVTTYIQKPMIPPTTGLGAVQDSGTSGNLITFSGGWDRTNMSTQTGVSWVSATYPRGNISMVDFNQKTFVRFDKVNVHGGRGFHMTGTDCQLGTVEGSCNGSSGTAELFTIAADRCSVDDALAVGSERVFSATATSRGAHISLAIAKGCGSTASSCGVSFGTSGSLFLDSWLCDDIQIYNQVGLANSWTNLDWFFGMRFKSITVDKCTAGGWSFTNYAWHNFVAETMNIQNCGAQGLFLNGSFGEIYDLTTAGNTTAAIKLDNTYMDGMIRIRKVTTSEATLVTNGTYWPGADGWVWLRDVNGTDLHKGYYEGKGVLVVSDTTTRHTASGVAWKWTTDATSFYSSDFPARYKVADVLLENGVATDIKVWTRRDDTGIYGRLKVYAGEVAGVSETTATASAAINTYEELSISVTSSETGWISVWIEVYGTVSKNVYWDDFSVSHRLENAVKLDNPDAGAPMLVGVVGVDTGYDMGGLDYSNEGAPFYGQVLDIIANATLGAGANTVTITAPTAALHAPAISLPFTDSFTNTGGSHVSIASWASVEMDDVTADWALQTGTSSGTLVANKDIQKLTFDPTASSGSINQYYVARVVNALLTGVSIYTVSGRIVPANGVETSFIGARLQSGSQSGYLVLMEYSFGVPIAKLYRIDSGTTTELDTFSTGMAVDTYYTVALTVSGSSLSWSCTGATQGVFFTNRSVTDATYATGAPGAGIRGWLTVFGPNAYMHVDEFGVAAVTSTTLIATTPEMTFTAPTAVLASPTTLAAGDNALTITAPTATVRSGVVLAAGANPMTLTAPTAILVATVRLVAGEVDLILSAPTATIAVRLSRKFPLERSEDVREVEADRQVLPAVARQLTSDIP